tara:strand:+ start:2807 stop:3004 length:198 start_codon:yes stop_codon:yes gene_type:complete
MDVIYYQTIESIIGGFTALALLITLGWFALKAWRMWLSHQQQIYIQKSIEGNELKHMQAYERGDK